jgi:GAF domain-containing protein
MKTSVDRIVAQLSIVAQAAAEGRDRGALYQATQDALGELVGHKLFTLLIVLPCGEEVQRVWSSDERSYPLTGRKQIGSTPWGELVLRNQRHFVGPDATAIRWAFADHELISSLGLASVINIPVRAQGRILGTMNLLDAENRYDESMAYIPGLFAPLLALAFTEEAALAR